MEESTVEPFEFVDFSNLQVVPGKPRRFLEDPLALDIKYEIKEEPSDMPYNDSSLGEEFFTPEVKEDPEDSKAENYMVHEDPLNTSGGLFFNQILPYSDSNLLPDLSQVPLKLNDSTILSHQVHTPLGGCSLNAHATHNILDTALMISSDMTTKPSVPPNDCSPSDLHPSFQNVLPPFNGASKVSHNNRLSIQALDKKSKLLSVSIHSSISSECLHSQESKQSLLLLTLKQKQIDKVTKTPQNQSQNPLSNFQTLIVSEPRSIAPVISKQKCMPQKQKSFKDKLLQSEIESKNHLFTLNLSFNRTFSSLDPSKTNSNINGNLAVNKLPICKTYSRKINNCKSRKQAIVDYSINDSKTNLRTFTNSRKSPTIKASSAKRLKALETVTTRHQTFIDKELLGSEHPLYDTVCSNDLVSSLSVQNTEETSFIPPVQNASSLAVCKGSVPEPNQPTCSPEILAYTLNPISSQFLDENRKADENIQNTQLTNETLSPDLFADNGGNLVESNNKSSHTVEASLHFQESLIHFTSLLHEIEKGCKAVGSEKKRYFSKTIFSCFHCKYTCKQKGHIRNHILASHLNMKPFKCKVCKLRFVQPGAVKRHISAVHSKDKIFKCSSCDFMSNRKEGIKRHYFAVHDNTFRPFQCSECSYKTYRKYYIDRHVSAVHRKIRPFGCPHCDYSAARAKHLKVHIQCKHEGIKPFSCSFCSFTASQNSNLRQHVNAIHKNLKLFTCFYCCFRTNYKNSLRGHIKVTHMGQETFMCYYCNYRVPSKSKLIQHFKKCKHR